MGATFLLLIVFTKVVLKINSCRNIGHLSAVHQQKTNFSWWTADISATAHKRKDEAARKLALACRKSAPKQPKRVRRTNNDLLPTWKKTFSLIKKLKYLYCFNLKLFKFKVFHVLIYSTKHNYPKEKHLKRRLIYLLVVRRTKNSRLINSQFVSINIRHPPGKG